MQRFVKTALVLGLLGAVVPTAWGGAMTIYSEWGDEIWCEDQYVAMNTLKNEAWQLGDGPVTIRLDEDLALSETFDFSWIDRDITLDLNGNRLKSDESADWFSDELLNIELTEDHSFTLQDGTVSGAKSKGAVRIAAGQRVTVTNVTFENNHCDGNLADLWEGDVGGAIRCNGNLKLVGCTFRRNSCTTHGGAVGLYSNDYQSRFVIENCSFEQNTAVEAGGALFIGCSGRIQNTTITGNTVTGREDGSTEGQNETTAGQGGGVYLTRHGGVSYGDESEGFWWGRFEGPTVMIEEGVVIDGNKASQKNGAAERTNNLYLLRHENLYNNAAVLVSGDTRSKTRVGLTLSEAPDVFTRTLNEEGGKWLTDDYSAWFFCDTAAWMRAVYDADEGLIRLADCRLVPGGEPQTLKAGTAEEAAAAAVELFAPPQEVAAALDEASVAAYSKMFAPVLTQLAAPGGNNPGQWSVAFELTAAATNTLVQTATAAQHAVLAAMLDPAVDMASFPACPGFFYAIEYGADPALGANTAGVLATGTVVELKKPDHTGSRGFFRVKVSPLAIEGHIQQGLPLAY